MQLQYRQRVEDILGKNVVKLIQYEMVSDRSFITNVISDDHIRKEYIRGQQFLLLSRQAKDV